MKNCEKLPADIAIERETKRVITDHLSTIYATSPGRAIKAGRGVIECEPASPVEVSRHIHDFFRQVDRLLTQIGLDYHLPLSCVKQGKLLFRQLYTTVSVESQVGAIIQGEEAARQIADGKVENIMTFPVDTSSGSLFKKSCNLILAQKNRRTTDPTVILVVDDVAHSGAQMASVVEMLHFNYGKIPVVISVGAVSMRAVDRISPKFGPSDQLLYQEKKLCLLELIARLPSQEQRDQLTKLMDRYWCYQNRNNSIGMNATHIVTAFKMPDSMSNGPLGRIDYEGERVTFSLGKIAREQSSLYPSAI